MTAFTGGRHTDPVHPCRPTRAACSPGPSCPARRSCSPAARGRRLLMQRILAPRGAGGRLGADRRRPGGLRRGATGDSSRPWSESFERAGAPHRAGNRTLSRERRLLIGAYFTHEFSVEAAALFNPSMVLAPDQSGLPPGHCRFVMSLRAVGEGHTSSIEFRSGIIDSGNEVTFDALGPKLVERSSDRSGELRQAGVQRQARRARRGKRHRRARALPAVGALHARRARSVRSRGSSRTALPLPSGTRPPRSSASSPRRATSRPSPPTPSWPSG